MLQLQSKKRKFCLYLAVAAPALAVVAFGWLMPLIVYGQFALVADGAGRAIDENGVCCAEPVAYYFARIAELLSPLVIIVCVVIALLIKKNSKKR